VLVHTGQRDLHVVALGEVPKTAERYGTGHVRVEDLLEVDDQRAGQRSLLGGIDQHLLSGVLECLGVREQKGAARKQWETTAAQHSGRSASLLWRP
jgi:hypothetical protein